MDVLPREMVYTPSEFVAEYNAALETVFPVVALEGELLNFKVAQNKWVYADIADDTAKIRLFGSVFNLLHQLSDGMKVKVIAQPRLHPLYGLSLNIESITPIGEGSIKKAAEELAKKLSAEGLFDESRKRRLPQYPKRVGLITSLESAAYADFTKIMNARWRGVELFAYHSGVQGEAAPRELCKALDVLNSLTPQLDAIALVRGGGSPEDLQAFSAEPVVRAIANSRVPTIAGVGHEIDISLAEMAADVAASTPSNAAELLFPDARDEARSVSAKADVLQAVIDQRLSDITDYLDDQRESLHEAIEGFIDDRERYLQTNSQYFQTTNPRMIMKRGYSVVSDEKGLLVASEKNLHRSKTYTVAFSDGEAKIKRI